MMIPCRVSDAGILSNYQGQGGRSSRLQSAVLLMSVGILDEQKGEDVTAVTRASSVDELPTRPSLVSVEDERVVKEVSSLVIESYPPLAQGKEGVRNLMRELLTEVWYDAQYVGWWLLTPFVGGLEHVTEGSKAPVVVVPGFCGRPRAFLGMRNRLAEAGHPVYVFESGWQWGCIVQKSRQLGDFLASLPLPPEGAIVVGHSMGGLITCCAMLRGEPRIHRLVAVGVPFHGSYTALAGLAVFLFLFCTYCGDATTALTCLVVLLSVPSTRQMLPGSDLLRSLGDQYERIADRITVIFSSGDEILFDRASAFPTRRCCEAAIEVKHLGHAFVAFGPPAIDLIVEQVSKSSKQP